MLTPARPGASCRLYVTPSAAPGPILLKFTVPAMRSPACVVPGKPFRVVVTSTSSLTAVLVVLQSPACRQAGLSGPLGTTVLT